MMNDMHTATHVPHQAELQMLIAENESQLAAKQAMDAPQADWDSVRSSNPHSGILLSPRLCARHGTQEFRTIYEYNY